MKAQTLQNKINALLEKIEILINVNMIDDYSDDCYSRKVYLKNSLGAMFRMAEDIKPTDMDSGK